MVAWITAGYHDAHVVVIEDGSAAVWQGRALRGVVSVDTRTDFWRLLAHARITIDLSPGEIIARECVESLRFGTPVIVPSSSAARAHANAGGGMTYQEPSELFEDIEHLANDDERNEYVAKGRAYADTQFGDPNEFEARLARALLVA
jgi:hypothetical protein